MLGDDMVDRVLHRRDRGAGTEPAHDPGERLVTRRGVEDDEAHAVLAVHRAASEVGLPTTPRVVAAGDHLGVALAQQIDFDGGVDRYEAVFAPDHPRVVHPVNRQELDCAVVVEEVV